jgi:hypothetical protein
MSPSALRGPMRGFWAQNRKSKFMHYRFAPGGAVLRKCVKGAPVLGRLHSAGATLSLVSTETEAIDSNTPSRRTSA